MLPAFFACGRLTSGQGAPDRGEYRQPARAAKKTVGMYNDAGATF
jgi:hypothetical protein